MADWKRGFFEPWSTTFVQADRLFLLLYLAESALGFHPDCRGLRLELAIRSLPGIPDKANRFIGDALNLTDSFGSRKRPFAKSNIRR